MRAVYRVLLWMSVLVCFSSALAQHQDRIEKVAHTPGLIAFWDFSTMNNDSVWISQFDETVVQKTFPAYLKRIGDSTHYSLSNWPYTDKNAVIEIDSTGPFGHAFRFNRGYLFGEVARDQFENTPLNLHGNNPFTMIAWVKFYGQRHMATGIWDEGGWNKYSGRRQAALFAGLFHKNSLTAHISATGAASYPQSTIWGSQYARERAIDGQDFENNEWVMLAMTFDPDNDTVTAMLNGEMTELDFTDEIVQDVYKYDSERAANPYDFKHPIYSPNNFLLKYNGYNYEDDAAYEQRLRVNLKDQYFQYDFEGDAEKLADRKFRISCDVERENVSILEQPIVFDAIAGQSYNLEPPLNIENGDVFITTLEMLKDSMWVQIGTDVERQVLKGAPFTFGRALGLGSGELSHGSQLYIDGVAVFNRILALDELKEICFIEKETRVGEHKNAKTMQPENCLLSPNYPNPFNPITNISYSLAKENMVMLKVFNAVGQQVAELLNERQVAGSHIVQFDAADLPSGVYMCQLTVGNEKYQQRMVLAQ